MRKVRVFASYRNLAARAVEGMDVVIVDVLRATTTIAYAVSRGASVMPLASVEEALAQRQQHGARVLVVGERMGHPLPGFDANNSTAELARFALDGMIVALTTTNGTRAVEACLSATRLFSAALTNAPAVAGHLARGQRLERDLALVCAGRNTGAIAFEDLVGVGAVVDAVVGAAQDLWLADGARIARALYREHAHRLADALVECDAGVELVEKGAADDVRAAAAYGSIATAAELRGGMFVSANRID